MAAVGGLRTHLTAAPWVRRSVAVGLVLLAPSLLAACGGSEPPQGSSGVVFHRNATRPDSGGFAASARRDRIIVFSSALNTAALRRAKAANPHVIALAYVDFTRLRPAAWGSTCVSVETARARGWDSGVRDPDGGDVARIDAPGYAETCRDRLIARLRATSPDWDGAMLDDFNCACDPRGSDEQRYAGADGARWRAAEEHLAAVVTAGLRRAGYLAFANFGPWGPQDLASHGWMTRQLRFFDGAQDEYFTTSRDGSPESPAAVLASVRALQVAQRQRKWFLAETITSDSARVRFALSLLLLHTRGKASLYAPTPSQPGQAERWWPAFAQVRRLGRPLGAARGLSRRFDGGTVRLQPGRAAAEIRAGG